jgi:hypothetical protein
VNGSNSSVLLMQDEHPAGSTGISGVGLKPKIPVKNSGIKK